jgi:hypothetical protein
MGWCSATSIFDAVIRELEQHPSNIDDDQKEDIAFGLAQVLERGDWDCADESDYLDLLYVRKALRRAGFHIPEPVCPSCGRILE